MRTNEQLQQSALAFVKQMRETDTQFERESREMNDRQYLAERQIPIEQQGRFLELRNKNIADSQQLQATHDNEFRDKYLGRGLSLRDQMLKRIPPDKVPSVNYNRGPAALDFGHLIGATTVGRIADYLEQLALSIPTK